MSDTDIKFGDKVEWTVTKRGRGCINFTLHYGTVVEILPCGKMVTVKCGRKLIDIAISNLHITGNGHNQLTKFIHAMGAR